MSYLDDSVFHAVRHLRDPQTLAPVLARALPAWSEAAPPADMRLHYLNYKPFERARLVLTAAPDINNAHRPAAAELFLEVQGAAQHFGGTNATGDGASDFDLPEWSTRGWWLSDAPGLEKLARLRALHALPEAIARVMGLDPALTEVDLVRYVPRKRAVLSIARRDRPSRVYAKLWRVKDASALATNYRAADRSARAGAFCFRVPEILECEPDLDTIFMSEVPGRPLTDVFRRGETAAFAAVGDALASLHRAEFQLTTTWTTADQLHDLRRHLAGMGRALPWLRERLEALVATLTALDPGPPEGNASAIHGNLFGDQILWDGARVGIVDWDRLVLGDPLYDVGRLIAHQVYASAVINSPPEKTRACEDALVRAYARAAHCQVEQRRLAWHVAVELLLRAKISALRTLPLGWREHCASAVAECERLIEGRCEFTGLPALSGTVEHVA